MQFTDLTRIQLAVVGAGVMGRGIAQIAAQAGCTVLLFDAKPNAAAAGVQELTQTFDKLAQKAKLSKEAATAAAARLRAVDALPQLQACDVVVEAVVEDLAVKRQLFAELETIVRPDCVLATNTSSLSVTAIAAGLKHPQRVAGFHFFNPVPLMKIVEVIDGLLTQPGVGDFLLKLGEHLGHTAVRAKDTPGFIVNHAGRGYGTEALRLLNEGVAEFHQIDRILRDTAGFKLGPFELMDLTALDVSHPVMESIYHQYYEEPRFRPQPLTRQMLAAGLVGRKVGRGFYRYVDGQAERYEEPPAPTVRPSRVWISSADERGHRKALELVRMLGGTIDEGERPADDSLCIVTPLGHDATTCATRERLDASRTVAIDTLFDSSRRRVVMSTPVTSVATLEQARGLFGSDGVPVSMIRDCAGLLAPRVVATIVNIACEIAQQRIARPHDIDLAVTLGLGYPRGPLAWGDHLGARTVLTVLDELLASTGDPRYRASPWLRRRAQLDVSLLTDEA